MTRHPATSSSRDPTPTLRVLGGAAVHLELEVEPRQQLLGPGKPFALYAYLACVGERVSREQLADLLWSDLEPDSARHALRQALWTIKKRLGDNVGGDGSLSSLVLETKNR